MAGGADQRITVRSTVHGPVLSDVIDGGGRRRRPGRPPSRRATRTRRMPSRSPGPGCCRADRRRDPRARPRHGLRRLPRGRALVRRARPEPALRRPPGAHRLPGAGAGADPAPGPAALPRRVLAGPGLGLDLRLAGLRRVLRAAVGARPGRRRHRRREPGASPQRRPRSSPPSGTTAGARPGSASGSPARPKVSPADMADVQLDTQDSFAKVLVPALLAVPLEASEADPDSGELLDFTREARELLRTLGLHHAGRRRGVRRGRRLLQRGVAQPARAALRRRAAGRASRPTATPGGARPCSGCSPTPRAPGGTTS